jgi:hypothetical protein
VSQNKAAYDDAWVGTDCDDLVDHSEDGGCLCKALSEVAIYVLSNQHTEIVHLIQMVPMEGNFDVIRLPLDYVTSLNA